MPRVTSLRLGDKLAERLDRLAAAMDRPRAWVIEQAGARHVADEARQLREIAGAPAEHRSGRATLHRHEGVMARLAAPLPASGDADPPA